MTPADIMRQAIEATEANSKAWTWVGSRMVATMGWGSAAEAIRDGILLDWAFGRVFQDPANPRLFTPAPAGEGFPCLLVPLTPETKMAGPGLWCAEAPDAEVADVLALGLNDGPSWFRRSHAAVPMVAGRGGLTGGDTLQLWQDPRPFLGALGRAALAADSAARTGRAPMHPVPPPEGWLVLDPAALPWKGAALKGVERIELVDAAPGGPLGRVLQRMNRRIGGRGKGAIELVRAA